MINDDPTIHLDTQVCSSYHYPHKQVFDINDDNANNDDDDDDDDDKELNCSTKKSQVKRQQVQCWMLKILL